MSPPLSLSLSHLYHWVNRPAPVPPPQREDCVPHPEASSRRHFHPFQVKATCVANYSPTPLHPFFCLIRWRYLHPQFNPTVGSQLVSRYIDDLVGSTTSRFYSLLRILPSYVRCKAGPWKLSWWEGREGVNWCRVRTSGLKMQLMPHFRPRYGATLRRSTPWQVKPAAFSSPCSKDSPGQTIPMGRRTQKMKPHLHTSFLLQSSSLRSLSWQKRGTQDSDRTHLSPLPSSTEASILCFRSTDWRDSSAACPTPSSSVLSDQSAHFLTDGSNYVSDGILFHVCSTGFFPRRPKGHAGGHDMHE